MTHLTPAHDHTKLPHLRIDFTSVSAESNLETLGFSALKIVAAAIKLAYLLHSVNEVA